MEWTVLVSIVAAVSGIILGWTSRTRSVRQDLIQEAGADALQRADVDYIKRGVDDIRLEQRVQARRVDVLAERVTRVEESAKQAHKRLDRKEEMGSV